MWTRVASTQSVPHASKLKKAPPLDCFVTIHTGKHCKRSSSKLWCSSTLTLEMTLAGYRTVGNVFEMQCLLKTSLAILDLFSAKEGCQFSTGWRAQRQQTFLECRVHEVVYERGQCAIWDNKAINSCYSQWWAQLLGLLSRACLLQ